MICAICGVTEDYDVHLHQSDPRWHEYTHIRRDGTVYRKDLSLMIKPHRHDWHSEPWMVSATVHNDHITDTRRYYRCTKCPALIYTPHEKAITR